MIYLNIQGGLGNQMFQYAAAYALSLEKKTTVGICLDKVQYNADQNPEITRRSFELENIFQLSNFSFVNPQTYQYIISGNESLFHKIRVRLKKAGSLFEQNLQYQASIHKLGSEAYIEGYFQSFRYFESYQAEIKKLFQFHQHPSEKTAQLLEQLQGFTAIGVHVRRGDFISSEANLKTHGVCPPVYYEEAARHFDGLDNVCFVVISDDPEWVKSNIRLGQKNIYVDWNYGADSWQDMLVLSKCDHAIIANSSFSWWGAYLIQNVHKTVIAPKIWYANPEKQAQTADLIPPGWIRC